MLHQLLFWHREDIRIVHRNEDGTVAKVACANCTCPKEAMGYTCHDRPGECETWDGYEVYDRGYDGPVVGYKYDFKA